MLRPVPYEERNFQSSETSHEYLEPGDHYASLIEELTQLCCFDSVPYQEKMHILCDGGYNISDAFVSAWHLRFKSDPEQYPPWCVLVPFRKPRGGSLLNHETIINGDLQAKRAPIEALFQKSVPAVENIPSAYTLGCQRSVGHRFGIQ